MGAWGSLGSRGAHGHGGMGDRGTGGTGDMGRWGHRGKGEQGDTKGHGGSRGARGLVQHQPLHHRAREPGEESSLESCGAPCGAGGVAVVSGPSPSLALGVSRGRDCARLADLETRGCSGGL